MKILVLGATGMLGNAVLRLFAQTPGVETTGTARSAGALKHLPPDVAARVVTGVDVENTDQLVGIFARAKPDVAINCVGLVKQLADAGDSLAAIPINALLPHRLARLAAATSARLIHMSTDCVFSGAKGNYVESDPADASDLYGRSKHMGEVDYPNAVTLRTSIIGHELASAHGLVGWFLAQTGEVKGYRRAIFSGFPTVELARIIRDHVLPRPELTGVWHVSAAPIAKYDLLGLVRDAYDRETGIVADDQLVIDRSLDSSRFRGVTGYAPPAWPALVAAMREFG